MQTYSQEQAPMRGSTRSADGVRRVNWWLRLTSSGWDRPQRTIQERERARRSRLTSWIVLGLMVADILLLPTSIGDPTTLTGLVVGAVTLMITAALNRFGLAIFAGSMLVVMIIGLLFGVIAGNSGDTVVNASAGQLTLALLPSYDLLAMAVVVAASILPRAAAFVVAGLNIALIWIDFTLQPHAADLQRYVSAQGALPQIARPIALQIIVATVAYLWVRGTDEAIRRADRAEEIAAMEHQLVEQKRQLDLGIRQILDTHVRVANGDFSARAPTSQDNVLFQIAASLNTLLNRLGRAAQSEYLLQRTVAEIGRLRASLLAAKAGRPPLWPNRTGTPVDTLIEVLAEPSLRPAGQPPTMNLNPGGAAGNSGGSRNSPQADPYPPYGGVSGPMQPPPSGGYGMPNSGPQGWRPDIPVRGETGPFSGIPPLNPTGDPSIGHPAGASPNGPGQNPWGLPDMPPLPDWLKSEDPSADG